MSWMSFHRERRSAGAGLLSEESLRHLNENVERLLATGVASNETTEGALAAGLPQVVEKLVDVARLFSLIRQVLV